MRCKCKCIPMLTRIMLFFLPKSVLFFTILFNMIMIVLVIAKKNSVEKMQIAFNSLNYPWTNNNDLSKSTRVWCESCARNNSTYLLQDI